MTNSTMTNAAYRKVSTLNKILIPVVLLVGAYLLTQFIKANPPKNTRSKGAPVSQVTVETQTIKPQVYNMVLNSFGNVQPRTQSVLVAQVSGEIKEVSSQFRNGGFFEKGDVLVQLDDRDHQAEVKINYSNLLSAEQGLLEEKARVEQALVDWQRLGNGKKPSDLVLRKPQLAAAEAKVLSAKANLKKSELALERTKIVAPYAGRILKKHVDLGSVMNTNAALADIYAIDYVEVRLPINNKDLSFMVLPEEYRDSDTDKKSNNTVNTNVTLTSNLIGKQSWQGRIVRTEGAIDESSQQLYIVAQIDNPYQQNNSTKAPLKIGQYITAEIQGKTLKQSLIIPSKTIYQGSYVYIAKKVEDKTVLLRKDIEIRWQNNTDALISSGLEFGDELVLTSLGQVSSGTMVQIAGEPLKRVKQKPHKEKKEPGKVGAKKITKENKLAETS